MSEALGFTACIAPLGLALAVHRAGLAHSVRCVGAAFYALAHGIVAGRAEFARLREESKKA